MKIVTKALINTLIFTTIGLILSMVIKLKTSEFLLSTLFNVAGIMFSVGIGLIATFNFSGLKNSNIISQLRYELKRVRNLFIVYFSISTLALITGKMVIDKEIDIINISRSTININISISFSLSILIIFCIAYFIINFLHLQKLNDEICDELNK